MMKRMRDWWDAWGLKRAFARERAKTPPPAAPAPLRKRISSAALAAAGPKAEERPTPKIEPYRPPQGVLPEGAKLAMDWAPGLDYLNAIAWDMTTAFMGFPALAQLQMKPEYRRMIGTIAEEMTRKWIRLTSQGDEDKKERIKELETAIKDFGLRDHFRRLSELDSGFGRAQLFVNVKTPSGGMPGPGELDKPLVLAPEKIAKGALLGFRTIEPVWTFPGPYNTTDPLAVDYYKPTTWYVMGKTVHATRLLTIVGNEVPDLLKAAFNFSGISLVQLAIPYVDNWVRTRDSVSDLVHSFSISGVATDMSSVLTEGDNGGDLFDRLDLFNRMRDNKGIFVLNKENEEFFQFNTPLSGLDKITAQAMEQMATPAAIPLVKFFGITPGGLNASTDGEIRTFYDHIHAKQEDDWRKPLTSAIQAIQLHLWGEVDTDIGFVFEPLWEPTATEAATIRKTDAETDAALVTAGAITGDESRERLIADPDSPYHSLESNNAALTIEEETEARQAERENALQTPASSDA